MIFYYKIGKSTKLHILDIDGEQLTKFIIDRVLIHKQVHIVDITDKPIKIKKYKTKKMEG